MDLIDGVTFCQDGFLSETFSAFEDMKRKEELVDFKITFEKRSITGHRVVLAARIPYFRMIFSSSEEEVRLSEIDPDALELVIDFAYTGRIEITPENVMSLLSASKVLQLTRVHEVCWEFVGKNLHSNNVLSFRKFAEDHHCLQHLDLIDNYVRQNFEEFATSESFLVFPFQQLKAVICRDDLKVTTEEKVYEAVIRWAQSSLSEREGLLPELLSAVRMYFLKPDYLIEIVSNEKIVKSSHRCRDLVDEAKNFHLLPEKRPELCRLPPQPRIYQKYHSLVPGNVPLRSLYAVCYSGYQVSVKILDYKSHMWSEISTSIVNEADAVVEMDGIIYIFRVTNILIFDLKALEWNIAKNPRNMNVSCSGAVTCNKRIYFFGGLENNASRVRCFDPLWKSWFEIGYMTKHLHNPGAASQGEFIYITGGMFGGKTSKAVERYDSTKIKWIELAPMKTGRYDHGCCSLNGRIYVCGGFFNEGNVLSSSEVYNPKANQWNDISAMKTPMYKVSVTTNNGRICVTGTSDKYSLRAGNMQVYDPSDDQWNDDIAIPDKQKLRVYLVTSEIK